MANNNELHAAYQVILNMIGKEISYIDHQSSAFEKTLVMMNVNILCNALEESTKKDQDLDIIDLQQIISKIINFHSLTSVNFKRAARRFEELLKNI